MVAEFKERQRDREPGGSSIVFLTDQQKSCSISSSIFYLLKAHTAAAAKSLQSCPTLCDPIDGSPPGSPVPGILQARLLEWVAISFSEKHILRRPKFKGQRNRVHLLMDNQCYIVRIHGMENISMIIFGTYLLHFFFFFWLIVIFISTPYSDTKWKFLLASGLNIGSKSLLLSFVPFWILIGILVGLLEKLYITLFIRAYLDHSGWLLNLFPCA